MTDEQRLLDGPVAFTPNNGQRTQAVLAHDGSAFTLAGWVKPKQARTGAYQAILHWEGADHTDRRPGLWCSPKGELHYDSREAGTKKRFDGVLANVFEDNTWVHIAWVKQDRTYRIYKNGALIAEKPAPANVHNPVSAYLLGETLHGELANVRVWAAAQPAAAILALSQQRPGQPAPARPSTNGGSDSAPVDGAEAVVKAAEGHLRELSMARVESLDERGRAQLRWTLAEGGEVRLSGLLSGLLADMELPPEIPDLELSRLDVLITPASGAYTVSGATRQGFAFPLGGLAVDSVVEFQIERGAPIKAPAPKPVAPPTPPTPPAPPAAPQMIPGPIYAHFSVTTEHTLDIVPGTLALSGGSTLRFLLNRTEQIDANGELIIANTPPPPRPTTGAAPASVQAWAVGGSLAAVILDTEYRLGAELAVTPTQRTVALRAERAGKTRLVNVPDVAWLDVSQLRVTFTRPAPRPAAPNSQGALPPPTPPAAPVRYEWDITAAGSFGMRIDTGIGAPVQLAVDGALKLFRTPQRSGLEFRTSRDSWLSLPIPFLGAPIELNLRLAEMSIARAAIDAAQSEIGMEAVANATLSGLDAPRNVPEKVRKALARIQSFLPKRTDLSLPEARLVVSASAVSITIANLLAPLELDLPKVTINDLKTKKPLVDLDLAPAAAQFSALSLSYGRATGLSLEGQIGFGIPRRFDIKPASGAPAAAQAFGSMLDSVINQALLPLLHTYDPDYDRAKAEPALVKFGLGLASGQGAGGGVTFRLVNSPLRVLSIDAQGMCTLDLGEFGALSFAIPVFQFNGSTFTLTNVRLQQTKPLQIPLKLLKDKLREQAKLGDAARGFLDLLPDALPLLKIEAFNEDDGKLNVSALLNALRALKTAAPGGFFTALEKALNVLASKAGQLPATFKEYLNIAVPESLSADIQITVDGSVRLKIATDPETPIKLLLPANPLGDLMGVQIRSLSFGELMSGSLLLAEVDATFDHFPLASLAAALAMPANSPYLPDPRTLSQRLIVRELMAVIIYQTVVPIPVPLFCTELGLEYRGLAGLTLQGHLGLPQPAVDLLQIATTVVELGQFLIDKDKLLKAGELGGLVRLTDGRQKSADLRLLIGRNYFELPKFITDDKGQPVKLGIDLSQSLELSAERTIATGLNALKQRSVNRLIQALPLNARVGTRTFSLFNLIRMEATWLLATPYEFDRLATALAAGGISEADRAELGLATYAELGIANKDDQRNLESNGWTTVENARAPMARLFDPVDSPFTKIFEADLLRPAHAGLAKNDQAALKAVKQALPARPGKDSQGVVCFARGDWRLAGGLVELDTALGVVAAGNGFVTLFRSRGAVNLGQNVELVSLDMWGMLSITKAGDAAAAPEFQGTGGIALRLLDQEMFYGVVSVRNNYPHPADSRKQVPALAIRGHLDLFPGVKLIKVAGQLDGHIIGDEIRLRGNAEVSLLDGRIPLAAASVELHRSGQNAYFGLSAELFGIRAQLTVASTGDLFVLEGTLSSALAIQEGQLLSFSGADGTGQPRIIYTQRRIREANGAVRYAAELLVNGRFTVAGTTVRGQLRFKDGRYDLEAYAEGSVLGVVTCGKASGTFTIEGGRPKLRPETILKLESKGIWRPDYRDIFVDEVAATQFALSARREAAESLLRQPALLRRLLEQKAAAGDDLGVKSRQALAVLNRPGGALDATADTDVLYPLITPYLRMGADDATNPRRARMALYELQPGLARADNGTILIAARSHKGELMVMELPNHGASSGTWVNLGGSIHPEAEPVVIPGVFGYSWVVYVRNANNQMAMRGKIGPVWTDWRVGSPDTTINSQISLVVEMLNKVPRILAHATNAAKQIVYEEASGGQATKWTDHRDRDCTGTPHFRRLPGSDVIRIVRGDGGNIWFKAGDHRLWRCWGEHDYFLSSPAVVSHETTIGVAARRLDDQIAFAYGSSKEMDDTAAKQGISGWAVLRGKTTGVPALVYYEEGTRFDLFARRDDGVLIHAYSSSKRAEWTNAARWSGWEDLKIKIVGSPNAFVHQGVFYIAMRTTHGSIAVLRWENGWHGPYDLGIPM